MDTTLVQKLYHKVVVALLLSQDYPAQGIHEILLVVEILIFTIDNDGDGPLNNFSLFRSVVLFALIWHASVVLKAVEGL